MSIATLFTPWQNFYVIVGSAGAALTGLQFVVMALVANADRRGGSDTVHAFGTPTIVHFTGVLAVGCTIAAPWRTLWAPTTLLVLGGASGVIYAIVVTLRASRQTAYKPVLEDWIWHSILPFAAYTAMAAGAITMSRSDGDGLFAIGGACLLLLVIGIHNAWDSVAYIATQIQGST